MDGSKRQTVLVVDDRPVNRRLCQKILESQYDVLLATGGEEALRLAAAASPDLVLLDILMPGMDGYAACAALKADPLTSAIPVIFLTTKSESEDEVRGLEAGAVDYVTKPFVPRILRARVQTHLSLRAAQEFLRDKTAFLEAEVRNRMAHISQVQDATIFALAALAEARDDETGEHIRRTQTYVAILARQLLATGHFSHYLSEQQIETLYKSAALHDIGKVAVPDHILRKPGRLTVDEFNIMKRHTTVGRDTILAAESRLDDPTSFLTSAREIAYSHHERWDGSGYPDGLAGEQIPIAARLMALADVYDALVTRRVYKPAYPHAQAAEMIRDLRGLQFDPVVVDAFWACQDQFQAISTQFQEQPEPSRTGSAVIIPLAATR